MRRFLTLLLLAVIVAGIWFFGSRLYAVHDLRQAAESGNVAELENRVDFPALRESLKAELEGRIDKAGLGPLGGLLARAGADAAIDEIVTAETVAQIVRSGQASGVRIAEQQDVREPVAWQIEGGNLHNFRAVGDGGGGALIFRRDGLGWRLAGIDLDAG